MGRVYERLQRALKKVREITDFIPETAIVLGSGLGALADEIQAVVSIKYDEIDGFPISTVEGHQGRFVMGYYNNVPVIVMQGRVHYYEGYSMEDVVMPVRLMGMLGAKKLILTNASGGIRSDLYTGALMLLTGHISLFVPNPLIGPNVEELGERFIDMTEVYDAQMSDAVRSAAEKLGVDLKEGVYVQLTGPSFETPHEIRMLAALGADAVGMSTVCEAIAARHMGLRVCAVSCVSNMAAGIQGKPLSHNDVQEAADKAGAQFKKLLKEAVSIIEKEERREER